MGFFYKHFIHPLLSNLLEKKALTNNPYLGMVMDSSDSDVIADELFRVGMAYYEGAYMLPKDFDKALLYFRKSADRGHAVAQLFMAMGKMKFNDDHSDEVLYWLQKAAEQGERQAMYNLGISYHRGDVGGNVDLCKSNELIRKSAEAGYHNAYARMAQIYLIGDGVEKNLKIAKYWAWLDFAFLPEEARNNSILIQLIESEDIDENNHIKHKKIIEEAIDAEERDAMNYLATSLNIADEKEMALALFQKAADLNHPTALCNLARHYLTEQAKDYKRAKELFEKASELGNEHAFYGLAVIYYHGLGVEKDIYKAWEYLEKAINKGDTEARYLLATMCLKNDFQTIMPDKVMRGMSYMELAAHDNYQPALEFLRTHNETIKDN